MKLFCNNNKLNDILKEHISKCDSGFKGLPISIQEECKDIIVKDYEKNCNEYAKSAGQKKAITLDSVITNSINRTQNNLESGNLGINLDVGSSGGVGALNMMFLPPAQSTFLYNKGIVRRITDGKFKSFLSTGIKIKNNYYSDVKLEKINENAYKKNFDVNVANGLCTSGAYSGALMFPMFKRDTSRTTNEPLKNLIKRGILGKDCIDYFVLLDRWNVFVIPPTNPTQKDFENPDYFIVPFLGSNVRATRCARIITTPNIGYWGKIINQGWGISDFITYIDSYFDYEMCIAALNGMIKNMSFIYRKLPMEGMIAANDFASTIQSLVDMKKNLRNDIEYDKIEGMVDFDSISDINCINRDFGDAYNIIKLKRQDLAAKANVYEPLIFTVEKGAFSSGDDTQGVLLKQYSNNEMLYKEVARELNNIAKILVIDTFGIDDTILEHIDDTYVEFERPLAVSALEKAQIGEHIAKTALNYNAMGIRADISIDIADETCENKGIFSKKIRNEIKEIAIEEYMLEKKKKEMEIKQLRNAQKIQNLQESGKSGDNNITSAKEKMEQKKENMTQNKIGEDRNNQRVSRTANVGARNV